MPQSIYDNGGMIGATLDFGDTEKYIISTSQVYGDIEYLGTVSTVQSGATIGALDLTPLGLQENDVVILAIAIGDSAAEPDGVQTTTAGYTPLGLALYANDVYDITLLAHYKRMSATPDISIGFDDSYDDPTTTRILMAQAYRGVDPNYTFSSYQTATQVNTGDISFPGATPTTPSGLVVSIGASGLNGADANWSHFHEQIGQPLSGMIPGISASGHTSQTYDAVLSMFPGGYPSGESWSVWNGGQVQDSANWSSAAYSIYLAPELVDLPVYGNQKNSGIWSLTAALEAAPQYGFISATTQSANATSMPVPTGLQAGDLLIYAFAADVAASSLGSSPSIPTGFTLGRGVGTASGGMVWAYKIADGSETTISPIDNGRTTENIHAAFIFREATISSTGSAQNTAGGATITPPSISALTNEYVIIIAAQDSASATATGPAGYTEIVDATGTDANIYIGYKQITSDGTEAPGAVTFSSTNLSDNDFSATFRIGPA